MFTRRELLGKAVLVMTYGAGSGHRRPDQRIIGTQRPGAGPAPGSQILIARRVIVVGPDDGLFVYAGSPGLGTLVASITASSGTDPYGNHYDTGITSYDNVFGGVTEITGALIQQFSGANLISEYGPGGYFLYSPAAGAGNLIVSLAPFGGTDAYGNTYYAGVVSYGSPAGTFTQLDGAQLTLLYAGSFLAARMVPVAEGELLITGGLETSGDTAMTVYLQSEVASGAGVPAMVLEGMAAAANPASPGTPEVWHNLGAPIAGWAASIARYKLLADSGLVLVEFQNVQPPAAAPVDGTTIWTVADGLPAPYPPNNNTRLPCSANAVAAASGVPAFQFQNDGSITVYGIHNANPTRMDGTFVLSTV